MNVKNAGKTMRSHSQYIRLSLSWEEYKLNNIMSRTVEFNEITS